MKRNWLIIPELEHLQEFCELAEKYDAAFEYNDFFSPNVYEDSKEIERRIEVYRSCGRDLSKDTLHGAFLSLCADSADPVLKNRSVMLMKQSMEIADRLGVRGVVFHSGLLNLNQEEYLNGWLTRMESVFRDLCEKYPEMDVFLENTTEQTPEMLVKMAVRMADVKNFKLCLDYAHAILTATSVEKWVEAMGPYVGHIHLNDNDGVFDSHLAAGDGMIDYALFQTLADQYMPKVPILLEVSGLKKAEKSLSFMNQLEKMAELHEKEPLYDAGQMMNVLETTLHIAQEKDTTRLLDMILNKSIEITHCDAGTLYILKDEHLHFKIMKTLSQGVDRGGDGKPIELPPVPLKETNVCAYSAMHKQRLNIPDLYDSDRFDFSGPKRYDQMTGYLTRSMLTIPLIDHKEQVLGVMQLLNAQDREGNLIPFAKELEKLVSIMAAQAAITMTKMKFTEELNAQLWSFTSAMAEVIDQRTPYNGSHTRKVAEYAGLVADKWNEYYEKGQETECFDESRKNQLKMAALLHDVGKMIIPISIMNKATRLGDRYDPVCQRFALMQAKNQIQYLSGEIEKEVYEETRDAMTEAFALVEKINTSGFVPKETQEQFLKYADRVFMDGDQEIRWFTEEEKEFLLIVKGTLTAKEREIMENHVVMTENILKKVLFNSEYQMTPVFAAQHHEFLNGRGYPYHLQEEEIPLESRILAVCDICDALLADDRPYKKALPKEKAFFILHDMAKEGSLDEHLVGYLEECLNG